MLLRIPFTKIYFIITNTNENKGKQLFSAMKRFLFRVGRIPSPAHASASLTLFDFHACSNKYLQHQLRGSTELDVYDFTICTNVDMVRNTVQGLIERMRGHHHDTPQVVVLDNAFSGLGEHVVDWLFDNLPETYIIISFPLHDLFRATRYAFLRVLKIR